MSLIGSWNKFIFSTVFTILLTATNLQSSDTMATSEAVARDGHLVTVDFEVFGVVQGK